MEAHSSCQITITLSQIGPDDKKARTGMLTVRDDAAGNVSGGGTSHSVPLTGTLAQAVASFNRQALTFTQNLGTSSGVNIGTNHFRFDYGLARKVTLQSLLYIQRELRNSGDFPNFFVPLNAFTPRQYRFQEQIVFSF